MAKLVGVSSEQPEWLWEERLARVREALCHWRERIKFPDEVMPGSSLAADDRGHPEMPCSQLAWWGLIVGVEHLDGAVGLLDRQLEQGEPILSAATYTVLRGALIGSSQAALLLGTPQREERVVYGLRIAREEYRQELNFRTSTVNHRAVAEADRQAVLEEDSLGWSRNGMARVDALLDERNAPKKRILDTDLIKEAARVVHRGEDADLLQLSLEMEWGLGSGSAHGRLLMNMHRPKGYHLDEEQGIGYFGTSKEAVTQQIATVWLALNEAWRMWDLRISA